MPDVNVGFYEDEQLEKADKGFLPIGITLCLVWCILFRFCRIKCILLLLGGVALSIFYRFQGTLLRPLFLFCLIIAALLMVKKIIFHSEKLMAE